MELIESLGSEF